MLILTIKSTYLSNNKAVEPFHRVPYLCKILYRRSCLYYASNESTIINLIVMLNGLHKILAKLIQSLIYRGNKECLIV